ncbi:[FeFe] hydrogenase H-cluster maturation GTPase HydF [Candidatus Sordicultor fermentans]|uniref:[FeFe] hydrogenase H-cluster maturation GTPase HydF n=1 Tax=Candidatus Sordicultor fermentans TaxID=1953203 RepID=UPI0016A25109|nr:[FeFe] hydrogenase H-cluster maturation GTPase HydF [Candidatus Atribacteria bacterium]
MTAQTTPRGLRPHIGLFGRRNVGKSSLINALTQQEVAIVSESPGTTTDPVFKAIELLPFGPVTLIDTAGLDDEGFLGELRKKKTMEILRRCDLALVIWDYNSDFTFEKELIDLLRSNGTTIIGVENKIDCPSPGKAFIDKNIPVFRVSAKTGEGIAELKQELISILQSSYEEKPLIKDLVSPGDMVVLVVPIDLGAPKGRLILPQVQTIRDLLDAEATAVVTKERELAETLKKLGSPPRMVVTDSQVFHKVAEVVPQEVPLTSFSILFARYKGDLLTLVEGAKTIETLKPGDRVLISEACTHHPVPDDIGRVKIPHWLRQRLGFEIKTEINVGASFPDNLSQYRLIIHCGACMLNPKEMYYRILTAKREGVPITNYGIAIAYLQGLFPRVLEVFPEMRVKPQGTEPSTIAFHRVAGE